MNGTFVGALCYADISGHRYGIGCKCNARCTHFADAHKYLLLNLSKTKSMLIDWSCSQLHKNVRYMRRSVEFVNSVDLLGVPLCAVLKVNHIHSNVHAEFLLWGK